MTQHELAQQLDRMITGYWVSQGIYAAARFAIADHLADGPKAVAELASLTDTNADALYRLLRMLASCGIFRESEGRTFELTEMAEFLRADVPGSKRALALMTGDEQFQAWGEIEYSIRTGRTGFEKVFGKPVFEYLGENPEKAKIFDAAMVGIHGRESDAVCQQYDFGQFATIADIGGGNGSQLRSLMGQYPDLKGVLFDLPHVVERAQPLMEQAGLADRCEFVAGDFFESIPAGADAYVMRHIIHDWDEEQVLTILRNCREAMSPEARLLVVESVLPEGNEPHGGKFLDLVMLMIPGGKERTEREYRELFEAAGFELLQIVATDSDVSVLEAKVKS